MIVVSPAKPVNVKLKPAVVIACLFACVVYECLRFKLGNDSGADTLLARITSLECVEVGLILWTIDWGATAPDIEPLEGAGVIGLIAVSMLLMGGKPIVPILLMTVYVVGRFGVRGPLRTPAIAIGLFAGQYVAQGWPFLGIHNRLSAVDAAAARTILRAAEIVTTGSGTFINLPEQKLGFDVNTGCTSSTTIAYVVPAFLIFVLCLRGSLKRGDALWGAALVLSVIAANWLRLTLICGTKNGYAYWHEGQGVDIFAAIYGVLLAAIWAFLGHAT